MFHLTSSLFRRAKIWDGYMGGIKAALKDAGIDTFRENALQTTRPVPHVKQVPAANIAQSQQPSGPANPKGSTSTQPVQG
jgi:hypothetical protein